MHHPKQAHFQLLKQLLRYIKGTIHSGLPIYRLKQYISCGKKKKRTLEDSVAKMASHFRETFCLVASPMLEI